MGTTVFTGPLLAGNVLNSDGTGNLSGVGGSSGQQNVGFCQMAQSQAITQATNGSVAGVFTTTIVIPAQSQITDIYLMVTAGWSGTAKTLGIGTTASATALTAAAAVDGTNVGQLTITPGTNATAIGNWNNTGTTDIEIVVTSTNTGTGAGVLTVCYLQAINGFTNGQYT